MESAAKIKEILQAASMEKLPEFIAEYENDPRSGVQKLVSSAQKKIDALGFERSGRLCAGGCRGADFVFSQDSN